jgi:molybdopterin biosynthesis enzyme
LILFRRHKHSLQGQRQKEKRGSSWRNRLLTPAIINMAAATGKGELLVKNFRAIVIISSGDELVEVDRLLAVQSAALK